MQYFSSMKNKSVVVTGGNKGIGKNIALSFAQLGANVVISGRNIEDLKETTEELKRHNPKCRYIPADLSKTKEIKKLFKSTVDYMGSIDILVNNAGINIAKPALDITEEEWDLVLNTNLKASFFCSQEAAKFMKKNHSGKIINIASQMGFVGYWDRSAYCASKGGIIQLTKALAIEWAPFKINVNAVAPTFIKTDLTSKMFENKKFKKDIYNRIPLGGLAEPSDVSGAVLYLSSDMAKFITGETIKVDGGWTAI